MIIIFFTSKVKGKIKKISKEERYENFECFLEFGS
jgi:hypothetical protein